MGVFLSILLFFVAVLAFIFVTSAVKIVRPYEKGLIERLGEYQRTVGPGLTLIIPFMDRLTYINMREQVVDVEPQEVITKDNVVVTVDAVIYYKVVDPVKVEYNIEDFDLAATKLAKTNLRDIVGDMQLDECLTSRDKINLTLRETLDTATDPWGVKVTRVELQKIDPPKDITEAMSKQMKAEREKRAVILEAQGSRESEITKAEGARQSKILVAEGDKQGEILAAEGHAAAIKLKAAANAEAIQKVSTSIEKYFTGRPEAFKKLETAKESFKGNAKYIIPSDLSNVLSFLGAGKKK